MTSRPLNAHRGLAIFDLDNTLLNGDSDHAWGQFLVDNGVVDADSYSRANDRFYQEYLDGNLDIKRYQEFALEPLTRIPPDQLEAWRQRFVESVVKPMLLYRGQQLLADHRQRGHYLLIITATNRFVTQPIADLLAVDDLIATEPEIRDGAYTGKIVGIPSFQTGKVARLVQWLDEQSAGDLESWFYTDSHNDVPLLEQVDHPVAVDPDPKLAELARERNWPAISLR